MPPAHMAQGSALEYSVAPRSASAPYAAEAPRTAFISAWQVQSMRWVFSACASNLPSAPTTTLANGWLPFARDCCDSAMACLSQDSSAADSSAMGRSRVPGLLQHAQADGVVARHELAQVDLFQFAA